MEDFDTYKPPKNVDLPRFVVENFEIPVDESVYFPYGSLQDSYSMSLLYQPLMLPENFELPEIPVVINHYRVEILPHNFTQDIPNSIHEDFVAPVHLPLVPFYVSVVEPPPFGELVQVGDNFEFRISPQDLKKKRVKRMSPLTAMIVVSPQDDQSMTVDILLHLPDM